MSLNSVKSAANQHISNLMKKQIDRFLAETKARVLPRSLHHYTTIAGLQGIIETGHIWATEAEYVNLHFPGLYAFDLIAMQPGEGSVIRADVER
jgi:hypothetical protein